MMTVSPCFFFPGVQKSQKKLLDMVEVRALGSRGFSPTFSFISVCGVSTRWASLWGSDSNNYKHLHQRKERKLSKASMFHPVPSWSFATVKSGTKWRFLNGNEVSSWMVMPGQTPSKGVQDSSEGFQFIIEGFDKAFPMSVWSRNILGMSNYDVMCNSVEVNGFSARIVLLWA